jgi:lysylphosphatidylglycerol synthetase-like protein (DUF2156 family)
VAEKIGDQLGWPLIVTITAVLCASAVGRDVQISGFAGALSVQAQRLCCWIAIVTAIVLGIFALREGVDPAWQPALFVAVLGCTILRRAAPVDLNIDNGVYRLFGWLGLIIVINIWRSIHNTTARGSQGSGETDVSALIIVGSLVFLSGVLISAVSFLRELRKASRESVEQS